MAITAGDTRPFDPSQPFSRADARAAGIGLKTLLSSRFHKIFYDCYVSSAVPLSTRLQAMAALGISPPGSFVSHATAARIWGGIVSEASDVHVTVPPTAVRSSRQGVKAHAGVIGAAVTRFRNLAISTPEQTFLDLATCLDLVALVWSVTASLGRAGLLLPLSTMPHWPGAAVAQSWLGEQPATFAMVSTRRWKPGFGC